MSAEPVAIVGVGAVLPNGLDADSVWGSLLAAQSAIEPVPPEIWDRDLYLDPTRRDRERSYSGVGAVLHGFEFDPQAFGLPPVVMSTLDPIHQVVLVAAREALSGAGIDGPTEGLRAAVVLGNLQAGAQMRGNFWFRLCHPSLVGTLEGLPAFQRLAEPARDALLDELRRAWRDQFAPPTSDMCPGLLANVAAARIAHYYNFHGPAETVDAACASSLVALDVAVSLLQSGRVDLAVTGGVDMLMDLPSYVGFCMMGALSPDGSYPFDKRANGFVMGEGGACFVLKRLSDARAAGDRVMAVVRGVGSASDGRGRSIVAPNPDGQVRAMREAWRAAGLDPAKTGYIEAHGTATPIGDPTEIHAMRQIFGDAERGSIPIGTVKGNIGHLKGAAGAAGLLRAVLALYHRTVPPEANFAEPNPACELDASPFRVPVEPEEWAGGEQAAVSAFGFGGINVHVVLEAGDRAGTAVDWAARPVRHAPEPPLGLPVIAFGAHSRADLLAVARRLRARVSAPAELAAECARGVAVAHQRFRAALYAPDEAALGAQLDALLAALEGTGSAARLAALGVALREDEAPFGPERVCFVFPGQGSQYLGMLDELAAHFPVVRETLDEADAIMAPILGRPLSAVISPPDGARDSAAFLALMRTEVLQPAMLACDEALRRLLATLVTPRAVLGHSLGEYAACTAAGILEMGDCLRIVAARGGAMEEVAIEDCGLMLGVGADETTVAAALEGIEGYVAIVNKNCPSQTILGGATAAVRAAEKKLKAQGLQCMQLPVSHAFHSEIVAPASEPLRRALDKVPVSKPSVPILSNVTGDFYPSHLDEKATAEWIRDTLARQVASPVEFIKNVEAAYADGCRVFVEVGPKRALAGFVSDILKDRPHRALYLAHPKHGELGSLGRALAALVADGAIDYGQRPLRTAKPLGVGAIEPRVPLVRTVAPAPYEEPAPTEIAAPAGARSNGRSRVGAGVRLGEPADPGVADDPRFWQFLALQGPTLVQSLVASFQAATSALGVRGSEGPTVRGSEGPTARGSDAGQAAAEIPVSALGRAPGQNGHAPEARAEAVAAAPQVEVATASETSGGWPADVEAWLLGRIAEATGYAVEELDLDADLEGELGIDSLRQIEVMLAVRDELGLPPEDGFRPADYPTLRALIDYVSRHRPAGAAASSSEKAGGNGHNGNVEAWVLERVADATGYAVEELALDADLEGELGIDSLRQIEVMLTIRDELGLEADDAFRPADYPTLRSLIRYVEERSAAPF